MFPFRHALASAALAASAVAGAWAAGPAAPTAPRLADPKLQALPPLKPAPTQDPAAADWRERNALVERLGGHAGHLRAPAAAPSAAAPAAAASAAGSR